MLKYERVILSHVKNNFDRLDGLTVIDIAGAPTALNRQLLREGIGEIHAINIRGLNPSDGFIPPGYYHHIGDARNYSSDFPQVDIVMAVCALEHLPDLSDVIKNSFEMLKSKGLLIMHGGSLWPCMLGHHVWVRTGDREYCFGSSTDPFPPWGHLSYSKTQLREIFDSRRIPASHQEIILEQVFESQAQNRLSVTELRRVFLNAGHILLGFHESRWGVPNSEIFRRVKAQGFNYGEDDLMTGELIVIMRKF